MTFRSPSSLRVLLGAAGLALAAGALSLSSPPAAQAQDDGPYPHKRLRLIVPFPPGGAADTIGRTLAAQLAERLGQPVVVENKPGGGTIIAAQAAAAAEPDGYTLSLASTGQLAINPALHAHLPYHPLKSFEPVALVAETPYVLSVSSQSPIRSLRDLIERARQQPGALTFSSCGNGTVCHLTGELLATQSETRLTHVPFAGSAAAITAVIGGHVTLASDTIAVQAPQIRAGALRPLVVTSTRRSGAFPDIPSAAEAGLPGLVSTSWFGIVVPAGTPRPIIERLNREIGASIATDAVRQQFDTLGMATLGGTTQQFASQIRADLDKWGNVVRVASVKVD
ncbi:MAG: tripartite tricarboxylate transporter substrate binding protein [Burkholderiaceae bacterium]